MHTVYIRFSTTNGWQVFTGRVSSERIDSSNNVLELVSKWFDKGYSVMLCQSFNDIISINKPV